MDSDDGAIRPNLKARLRRIQEIPAVYLWGVFCLFALYRSVIVADDRIGLLPYGVALINALALAKIALVAEALHLGNQVNVPRSSTRRS